jgi:Sec-independent protein secretion pathway component TatC
MSWPQALKSLGLFCAGTLFAYKKVVPEGRRRLSTIEYMFDVMRRMYAQDDLDMI